jgi:hypothetical protein
MALKYEMREIWKEAIKTLRKAMNIFYEVRLCSLRESMSGLHRYETAGMVKTQP